VFVQYQGLSAKGGRLRLGARNLKWKAGIKDRFG
jgi:hypothetical protein